MLRRRRMSGIVGAFALALAAASPVAAGDLRGQLVLDLPGVDLADVSPVVVYLEPADERERTPVLLPHPKIRQKEARFEPSFLAIGPGETVEMPNEDAIFHNVFSFSRPNDFDLGLYPSGEFRSVTFDHPGVVRIYCSIHESMNGVVFVAPTPWYAHGETDGSFEIRDVSPGRWRLHTWSAALPATEQDVLMGEKNQEIRIDLAGSGTP
jgi:hypothetical protein